MSSSKKFVVDLHTHILPKNWPNLKEKYGYGGWVELEHHHPCKANMIIDGKCFREIDDNCYNPDTRITECDRDGVDVQVLSTVPVMFSYWAKPQDTLDLSQYLNDHLAQVVSENPKRFVGLGTLPMQAPELAVQELRRCIQDLGLAGVQIGSHVNGMNLDHPSLFPIFEEAERLGAAIFVHPWDMLAKDRMSKYWMPWLVGMPTETAIAICSVLFGGILERLPKLKIAFAHGGGSFPQLIGRLEHGFEMRPDLCATDNQHPPSKYLGQFWVDSLVHTPELLQALVKLLGTNRVCMGTDYPFPLGELAPGKLIKDSGFNGKTEELLLGENALEFLGLTKDKFL